MEQIGRCCDVLMKATEKEIEHLEKKVREDSHLDSSVENVQIPMFKVLKMQWWKKEQEEAENKRSELESKVEESEGQMRAIQECMIVLNQFTRESNTSHKST